MKSRSVRFCIALLVPSLLMTSPLAAQDDQEPVATAEQPAVVNTFVVRMKNNKFLRGSLIDLASIDVYVLSTKIPVPLDRINGIRFAQGGDDKGTVVLTNGEMLSGRIEPPKINLAVEWGEARINSDVVTSMVRNGDMQWNMRNTPNGPQWFLGPRTYRSSSIYTPSSGLVSPTPQSYSSPDAVEYAPANANPGNSFNQPVGFGETIPQGQPNSIRSLEDKAFPTVDPHEFAWIW